jgi:hypothetical protein
VARTYQRETRCRQTVPRRVHVRLVEFEAFAHPAGEAVTRLPHASDPRLGRDFTGLCALVSEVATDAAVAVIHGDQLIAALSAYLDAQRTNPD